VQQAELKETIVMQQLKLSKVGPEAVPRVETIIPQSNRQEAEREEKEQMARERLERRKESKREKKASWNAWKKEQEREASVRDAEQGLSSSKPTHPPSEPEVTPEAFSNSTPESPKTQQGINEESPTTPEPCPTPGNTKPESPPLLLEHVERPKATTQPALTPKQKTSGWGSWGSSLVTNIANVVERPPSPQFSPVHPKVLGAGGSGENLWSGAKNGPTPIAQKPSTGPAWGASVAQIPPMSNTPDPDNADDSAAGGVPKKKKKGMRSTGPTTN
jgi:hypothetical protein